MRREDFERENSARTPCFESPLKLQSHLLRLLETNCQRYTDLSAAAYLLHTALGNGKMNIFGICMQQHNEHFKPRMLFFSLGNGALNALRYWQLCSKPPTILATAQWTLPVIGNGAMNPPRYWQRRYEPCVMVSVLMLRPVRLFKENSETQMPPIPTAPLETVSKFVLSAIANSCM